MTTPHTIESPAEYTPEEHIAALRKLGAYQYADTPSYFNYEGYEAAHCDELHTFLRTDPHGWMAMNDVLRLANPTRLECDVNGFRFTY